MNFSKLKKVYIIAESGVNHNGSLRKAIEMVKLAKKAGADAIKFQSFSADNLALKVTPKTHYQSRNLNSKISHYQMLKKLELSNLETIHLMKICKKLSIDFISTPYDVENAKFLLKNKVKVIKIASADIVDFFLHKYLRKKKCSIIISTGMTDIKEIKDALRYYKNFDKKKICLLHCVSNYPCSNDYLNMNCLMEIKKLGYQIGFSDHTDNDVASVLSIGMGCKVVEKHFTLNKNYVGPDHKASLNPDELKSFIKNIRIAEKSLGKFKKFCQNEELNMKKVSRKSLVSARSIKMGKKIKIHDIKLMRPGYGISPFHIKKILNKVTTKVIKKNTILNLNMFK